MFVDDLSPDEGTPVAYAPPLPVLPVFDTEVLTPRLVGEVTPLLRLHWEEVGPWKDVPLDPDWLRYFLLNDHGKLRIFTARLAGRLVGYNAFFVGPHIHYKTFDAAQNDVIFVDPSIRGMGKHLRAYSEMKLREEGWQLQSYHVKREHAGWEAGLAREGFLAMETVWVKRLDQGGG